MEEDLWKAINEIDNKILNERRMTDSEFERVWKAIDRLNEKLKEVVS